MSKSTILATGRIAGAEVITITYIQPADAPSMIMLRWPGQPSVTTPDRLPAVANAVMAVSGGHRQTGPDSGGGKTTNFAKNRSRRTRRGSIR